MFFRKRSTLTRFHERQASYANSAADRAFPQFAPHTSRQSPAPQSLRNLKLFGIFSVYSLPWVYSIYQVSVTSRICTRIHHQPARSSVLGRLVQTSPFGRYWHIVRLEWADGKALVSWIMDSLADMLMKLQNVDSTVQRLQPHL